MKGFYSVALASALTGALAAPTPADNGPLAARAACSSPVQLSGNPFTGRKIYANKFYADEVNKAAAAISDATLAAAAKKVADVGTFFWM